MLASMPHCAFIDLALTAKNFIFPAFPPLLPHPPTKFPPQLSCPDRYTFLGCDWGNPRTTTRQAGGAFLPLSVPLSHPWPSFHRPGGSLVPKLCPTWEPHGEAPRRTQSHQPGAPLVLARKVSRSNKSTTKCRDQGSHLPT